MAALLAGCDWLEGDAPAMPPMAVQVVKAKRTDVPLFFEMVGGTLGNQDVPIRARVEGFLESRDFEEGTFVKKGDLLYTIDPQPFKAKLVAAQSELAAAQTRLAKAQSDLARIKPLAEMNAVSQQDLDSAVAQEAASRAAVEAAEAGVELAEIELSYTRIQAPIDGLIGLTKAKPGEFVGREPNPVVLNTLSDIDPIRVRFSISEREYLTLARGVLQEGGREVRANRDGNPLQLILADGTEYKHVGYLDGSAQSIDSSTGTFTLEATFENPDSLLLPGQFARVRAEYTTLTNAVVIPRQAVVELQGRFQVYVVNADNIVELVQVQTGPPKGNDIVIESGLNGGERVIVEGVQKVRPGMAVEPQPFDPPTASAPLQET
ncbi:MAG: efflux RND transporter periplasmic adaptor subunit [Gammaproteobacteria bacterium]